MKLVVLVFLIFLYRFIANLASNDISVTVGFMQDHDIFIDFYLAANRINEPTN
jgi:hypothetical protein